MTSRRRTRRAQRKRVPANATFRRQYISCGKCRACAAGPSHGPYWYAEWRGDDRRTKTVYVGAELRPIYKGKWIYFKQRR